MADLVPVSKLKANPTNPRVLRDEKFLKLKASIQSFPDMLNYRGIVAVTDTDGKFMVLGGNMRLRAIQDLGIKDVPVMLADHWTEEQRREFIIKDNVGFGEWDWEQLANEWDGEQLQEWGLDLPVDFNADTNEGLTDPDEVPEVPETPITVLGDVWVMGKHRVLCGSCTDPDQVSNLMGAVYPDLIHTDPPYGMSAVSKSGVLSKSYGTDILGDDSPDVAKDAFTLIHSLYPDAKHIWWGANYYSSILPDSECWLVWDKDNGQSDQTDCELAWANFRSVVRQFTMASEKTNRVHPTQKPVALMEWIIKRFKLTSHTIADYFGGSGSTLIAAERNGITGYIMELDPRFVDVIVKRWQDFTGQQAIHEASGKTFTELAEAQLTTV